MNPVVVYALVAAIAASALSGWQGYRMGVNNTEAKQVLNVRELEARLDKQAQVSRATAARIEADRQTIETLALRLENEARNDGVDRTPSADSLRRLREGFGPR